MIGPGVLGRLAKRAARWQTMGIANDGVGGMAWRWDGGFQIPIGRMYPRLICGSCHLVMPPSVRVHTPSREPERKKTASRNHTPGPRKRRWDTEMGARPDSARPAMRRSCVDE